MNIIQKNRSRISSGSQKISFWNFVGGHENFVLDFRRNFVLEFRRGLLKFRRRTSEISSADFGNFVVGRRQFRRLTSETSTLFSFAAIRARETYKVSACQLLGHARVKGLHQAILQARSGANPFPPFVITVIITHHHHHHHHHYDQHHGCRHHHHHIITPIIAISIAIMMDISIISTLKVILIAFIGQSSIFVCVTIITITTTRASIVKIVIVIVVVIATLRFLIARTPEVKTRQQANS